MKGLVVRLIAVSFLAAVAFGCMSMSKIPRDPSDQEIRASSVKVFTPGKGSCSGTEIKAPSGKTYILTAGHCAPLADAKGEFQIESESHKLYKSRIVKEDSRADLLLLEGIKSIPALSIAKKLPGVGDEIKGFTHGAGHNSYRSLGELLEIKQVDIPVSGEREDGSISCPNMPKYSIKDILVMGMFPMRVCVLTEKIIFTNASISPGSSGGSFVNHKGEIIGIVSIGDGVFGGLVPLKDIRAFLSKY